MFPESAYPASLEDVKYLTEGRYSKPGWYQAEKDVLLIQVGAREFTVHIWFGTTVEKVISSLNRITHLPEVLSHEEVGSFGCGGGTGGVSIEASDHSTPTDGKAD